MSANRVSFDALSRALIVVMALLVLSPHAFGQQPSFQHVENLTRTFRAERDFTAIASSPSDPDTMYIGTSEGWIYSSTDGGASWSETQLEFYYPRLPSRDPNRLLRGLWSNYVLSLGYLDMVEYPQWHGTVNLFRVHQLWATQGFRIERLNPNPALFASASHFINIIGGRYSRLTPELHYHDTVFGGGVLGAGVLFREVSALPLRLSSTLQPSLPRSIRVNWLAVHPDNPRYVLAATSDGIFRSTDGGAAWVREFDHLEESSRRIRHISFDPNTPSRRYACRGRGLIVSEDSGTSYERVLDPILSRKSCFFVTGRRGRPGEVWVGTDHGVWMSEDGGASFVRRHVEQAPGRKMIKRVVFDPDDPQRLATMANEVIFTSDDGGHTFERKGTTTFKAQVVNSVVFGPAERHLIVSTNRDIYQSFDDGETWEVLLFGNLRWTIRRITFPRGLTGALWALTSYELFRLTERQAWELTESQLRELRATTANEPSMTEAMYEGLRAHGVLRPQLNRRRAKSRWSHALPFLTAAVSRRGFGVEQRQFGLTFGGAGMGGELPLGLGSGGPYEDLHWQVFAQWDLQSLVFDAEEMPKGPVFWENEKLARSLRDSISSVYAERRRLQIQAAARADTDLRAIVLRDLRIDELTQQLNLLTDGLFERYAAGERIESWPENDGG